MAGIPPLYHVGVYIILVETLNYIPGINSKHHEVRTAFPFDTPINSNGVLHCSVSPQMYTRYQDQVPGMCLRQGREGGPGRLSVRCGACPSQDDGMALRCLIGLRVLYCDLLSLVSWLCWTSTIRRTVLICDVENMHLANRRGIIAVR